MSETKAVGKAKIPAKKSNPAPKAAPKKETAAAKPATVKSAYGIQKLVTETGFTQIKVRALLRSLAIPKNGSRYGWDRKSDFDGVVKQLKNAPTGTVGRPKSTTDKPETKKAETPKKPAVKKPAKPKKAKPVKEPEEVGVSESGDEMDVESEGDDEGGDIPGTGDAE